MKSSGVIFWLVVLFVFSGTAMGVLLYRMANREPISGSETVVDPYAMPSLSNGEITEFTLTERSGEPFSSQELEGEVWVVSFFFATCPRECKQLNRHIQELQREFGNEGVKFVSISCDPLHDTPSVLSQYAQQFNADDEKWLFLTGNPQYIDRIGEEMFRMSVFDDKMGPAHPPFITVVDRAGQLHYYAWQEPRIFAEMKTDLSTFLAQTPEEARVAAGLAEDPEEATAEEAAPAESPEAEEETPAHDGTSVEESSPENTSNEETTTEETPTADATAVPLGTP